MGCFVRGGKNGMGCFVRGDKNCMGCFVRGGKLMRDVLSGVAKNGMGCFVPGCFVLHSAFLGIVVTLTSLLTMNLMKGLMMHIIGQEQHNFLDYYNVLE